MGIEKGEPVGLWLCVSCRKVPKDIKSEISCLKDDIDNLKLSTNQILSTVNELAAKLDNCIGGINDRITALNRQVNLHDRNITETLDNLTSKTSNIKTSIDQKTSQILNKTSAVFDKLKTHEKSINQHTNMQLNENNEHDPKTIVRSQNESRMSNSQRNPIQTKNSVNSNKTPAASLRSGNETKSKESSRVQQQQKQQQQHQQKRPWISTQNQNDILDLTKRCKPKQTIKQSTLLTGSSILKNIKTEDLNDDVAVKTIPGATIETLTSKINDLDIELCTTVIIHVGGNDADNGADLDTFRENFDTLINTVCDGTRRVIVSEPLPRESVDLEPYNETLSSLCADNAVEFVENYNSFLLATGEIPDTFFFLKIKYTSMLLALGSC